MSKFWQKKYTSKYTGAQIDAAIGKANPLPSVTSDDSGLFLMVDDEGNIVPEEVSGGDNSWIFQYNSSFNQLTFDGVNPVTPSNFPDSNNIRFRLNNGSILQLSKLSFEGATKEVCFEGRNYQAGATTTNILTYIRFRSTAADSPFTAYATINSPILPSIGPNDSGKYLAVKSDGTGLEWVEIIS